jgi:hypothetical protein
MSIGIDRKISSMEVSEKQKYGYNAVPRLSANTLSEYLTATSTRRKSIVQAAKFPKTAIVARYDAARDGITKYLCDLGRDAGILIDAMDSQKTRGENIEASEWIKNDSALSIEAIDNFHKAMNKLGLSKLECRPVTTNQPHLTIEGVRISVSLDATVHRKESVGGLILLFSKAEPSTTSRIDRCKTAAVLAYLFTEQNLKYLGVPDHKLCFSVDVFGGKAHATPNTYKKKLDYIQSSCEEVALRWPITAPPADYDGPPWT